MTLRALYEVCLRRLKEPQQDVEMHATQLWVVSAAEPRLPLLIEDASRMITEEVTAISLLNY